MLSHAEDTPLCLDDNSPPLWRGRGWVFSLVEGTGEGLFLPCRGVGGHKKRENFKGPLIFNILIKRYSELLASLSVTAHELVNTTCSIHQFALTCVEGV